MKIELTIRRPKGSNTAIPNGDDTFTNYKFGPLDPTRADSPHVAEVSDEHGEFLLRLDPCYRIFRAAAVKADLPKPAPKVEAAPAPTPAPETPAEAADTNDNGVLSVAEFNKALAAGKFDELALRELLAKEEESETPRSSFIAAVTKALKK